MSPSLPTCSAQLAERLRRAVQALDFASTADNWRAGAPLDAFPSIDLAVVVFSGGKELPVQLPVQEPVQAQVFANVLFSREHPQGVVAEIEPNAGALRQIRFDADRQDAAGQSAAWLPGADWSKLVWQPLPGLTDRSGPRFVAPYPASLLKLMVAVGVALAVDEGRCDWPEALAPMITVSDNQATETCVALLHHLGWLPKRLNQEFAAWGLPTLQLHDTTPAGGWRNADGSGVGHIHMTAWDTVRLLWLLDADAPPAPWLPTGGALLSTGSRDRLRALLAAQQLDELLSSGSLRGLPGWLPGLPDAPAFAHKTGTTDNFASDAGIVKHAGLHYIVAVLSNLGRRYAPHGRCASTWRLPALGAAVEAGVGTAFSAASSTVADAAAPGPAPSGAWHPSQPTSTTA